MRWKLFIEFCLTIFVLFVVAGDILLPQPYRGESQQLKSNINYFIIGLLPHHFNIKIKDRQKDNF